MKIPIPELSSLISKHRDFKEAGGGYWTHKPTNMTMSPSEINTGSFNCKWILAQALFNLGFKKSWSNIVKDMQLYE